MLSDERLRGVDWLLIEGTTLGSSGGTHGLSSKADVEEKLVELARGDAGKLVAVVASGQNVDRLVSCYKAAKRSGRQLVVDPYQAYVLMKLAGGKARADVDRKALLAGAMVRKDEVELVVLPVALEVVA